MKKLRSFTLGLWCTILAVTACTDDSLQPNNSGRPDYPTTPITLSLTNELTVPTKNGAMRNEEILNTQIGPATATSETAPGTRAGQAEDEPETVIQDVCLFQFDKATGILKHSGYYTDILSGENGHKLVDIALRTNGMTECELYILANAGDHTSTLTVDKSTLDDLLALSTEVTEENQQTWANGAYSLSGKSGTVSLENIPLTVPVQMLRAVARVDLNLTHDGNFKFHRATLHNIPSRMHLFTPKDTTAADVFSLHFLPAESNTDDPAHITASWVIPENRRGKGTVSGSSAWGERNENHAPFGSSFIQISGLYTEEGKDVEVVYIVLLGSATDANDFNVNRNTHYTLNISVNSADIDADGRIIRIIDLSEPGTANCYLTNKTHWWYKLKGTVRGNGAATDADISPTGQALAKDAKIVPQSAELLWETRGHRQIIQQVEWPGNGNEYVYFKTGYNKEGNAVICAKDGTTEESQVLWSWHIWHSELMLESIPEQTYVTAPKTVAGYYTPAPRSLRVMDRNLGSYDKGPLYVDEAPRAFGMYYQWGRKDPFPSSSKIGTAETMPIYDKSGTIINTKISPYYTTPSPTWALAWQSIAYAVGHPATNIYHLTNWVYNAGVSTPNLTSVQKLWGTPFQEVTQFFLDRYVGKTIYDPCPANYTVAPSDIMTNFGNIAQYYRIPLNTSLNTIPAEQKGLNMYAGYYWGRQFYINGTSGETAWFPAANYGTVNVVTRHAGIIWTTGAGGGPGGSLAHALYCGFDDSLFYILASTHGRATLSPVRCVREEDALANEHLKGN